MTGDPAQRWLGSLAAPDIEQVLGPRSVLCLPIGSYEQHGPHLPLHTDTVIAERFTRRLIARYGDQYDLWALPTVPYGLSPEHAWSPGTITLPVSVAAELIGAICAEHLRATPARNLVVVNGHGGNRAILETVVNDLRRRYPINVCILHPSSLSTIGADQGVPEIHASCRETSVMLALSPQDVHLERLPSDYRPEPLPAGAIRRRVLDRGVTWPWSSDDPTISQLGIIGTDARQATAELGEQIITSALDRCADILADLASTEPAPVRRPPCQTSN